MVNDFRQIIVNWYEQKKFKKIDFKENFIDEIEDRYQIKYRAVFEPRDSLTKARVELDYTETGLIGVGFERWDRVAARRNCKFMLGYKNRFASGHEPIRVPIEGVVQLLEEIASGNIALKTFCMFGILTSIKAVTTNDVRDRLNKKGYSFNSWYFVANSTENLDNLVRYDPWE